MDSLRVLSDRWIDTGSIGDLISALPTHPKLVEEIVFFTGYYHCAQAIKDVRPRIEGIASVFPLLRSAGYRVGVNAIVTTGHHNENLEIAACNSLPRQVGMDGRTCQGALCPADTRVHEYVRDLYLCLASCEPDIIWVDDDVRLSGHLPTFGCCLCDGCVASFGQEIGEPFTHQSLVEAFDDSELARRTRIRRLFMERNSRVIRDLLALIESTVHSVSPKIELGMMTGDRFWEGYGFDEWAKALRHDTELPVRWRPGGGFYCDEKPGELLEKAHQMGRQVSVLPSYVSVIQSEIENFPYQQLRKAAQVNVLEMTAYLFAGCTGSALNILGQEGNPLGESSYLLERLGRHVSFWDILKKELAGAVSIGVWAAWDPMQITAGLPGQTNGILDFFSDIERDMNSPYGLAELGIPICYQEEHGCLTAVSGRMPYALGVERMKDLLAKGVLLDAIALESLWHMGLGSLTGVKLGRRYDADTQEVFTSHPLNHEFSEWSRDCRQSFSFWNETAYELISLTEETGVLAQIRDYQGRCRGASVSVYENQLGGRVGVLSYFPWTFNQSLARVSQMRFLCDWLSQYKMPLLVKTTSRIVPWVREHKDGRLVVGLLNLSSDSYESINIFVRSSWSGFRRLSMDGDIQPLIANKADGGFDLKLTNIKPYTFEVLLCGDSLDGEADS